MALKEIRYLVLHRDCLQRNELPILDGGREDPPRGIDSGVVFQIGSGEKLVVAEEGFDPPLGVPEVLDDGVDIDALRSVNRVLEKEPRLDPVASFVVPLLVLLHVAVHQGHNLRVFHEVFRVEVDALPALDELLPDPS